MRAVNLLPREEVTKSFEKNRGVAFGAAGGAALVTAAICALMLGASGSIKERQLALNSLNAELLAVPKPIADPNEAGTAALGVEKSARTAALSTALAGRVAWDRMLREVSLVLPDDVWLVSLVTQAASVDPEAPAPDPASGTTASTVKLVGSTYSQSGVARFLSRLAVVPALTGVTLQASTSAVVGEQRLVQFEIHAQVKPPGEGAGA
jgi:Tfp pilus assembly protein PilN